MLKYVEHLWNNCEIRVLVIISLLLQIFLLGTAGNRNCVISIRRQLFLWIAYLLADYVATFALGYLSQSAETNHKLNQPDENNHLRVFWAPFLLLHLGGQDNITAFSIEDNELWKRHLLNLISQVSLAFYVFAKAWQSTQLLVPAVFMFVAGCLKYAERTWALQRASMSSLRSSMVKEPDPGPNYAKFMEEYYSSKAAGLVAKIEVVEESQEDSNPASSDLENQLDVIPVEMPYQTVVPKAHMFFQTFKRLFVDLILSFEHRKESQDLFVKLEVKKAYKVIEIELSFMYEILHTKAAIIYTQYGWLFRCTTLICTTLALTFFSLSHKNGYKPVDVVVTYILLCGAVLLETVAIIFMLLSFWTFVAFSKIARSKKVIDFHFLVIQKVHPEEKSSWSDKMAQFNLINYCLNDKPTFLMKTMKSVGFKETWDNYRYTSYTPVDRDLKELVFTELKNKMNSIVDAASYRSFINHRGQWVLQRKGYYGELGWSVNAELDESILLWHIATDLLFLSEKDSCTKYTKISHKISNYLLFILVVRTSMLPAGIGQIRFSDTCAEAKNFLTREKVDEVRAAKMILEVNTDYEPKHIKGDRSKSVLFDGCRLAHQLQKLFPQDGTPARNSGKMWELISVVWVEMLCFAASKCRGIFHARQLSMGGELLTVVWFLMAHLGLGEQYRIEAGHARAKLIVEK